MSDEYIEGTFNGRRYRKLKSGPFASYPPTEADFIDDEPYDIAKPESALEKLKSRILGRQSTKSPELQSVNDASQQMRQFRSLREFREFIREVNARNDEQSAIGTLSNSYLTDPDMVDAPSDPFSHEYRDFVVDTWQRLSGRRIYDAAENEKIPLHIDSTVARPAIYHHDSAFLGSYFEAFGHILRRINAQKGMRILEYGPGDAQISLHLARLGCDVTVIDIEPAYLEVVTRQASNLGVPIKAIQGGFLAGADLPKFDRVFFFQAFHHSLEHLEVLSQLRLMLNPGGKLVFATEPIVDPEGPWRHAVPYPWGLRLDGLSLRAIMTHGWMELGFQEPYFRDALHRYGWTFDKEVSATNGLCFTICATRAQ